MAVGAVGCRATQIPLKCDNTVSLVPRYPLTHTALQAEGRPAPAGLLFRAHRAAGALRWFHPHQGFIGSGQVLMARSIPGKQKRALNPNRALPTLDLFVG